MNHPASSLSINSISIRQDAQGRYSLGDLYRASGSNNKDKPTKWLRYQKAKDLIHELELEALNRDSNFGDTRELEDQIWSSNSVRAEKLGGLISPPNSAKISPVNTVRGHGITDTYVVKELVYAYAMWISPAFHLHVIRAYDAMVSGELNKFLKPARQHEKYWFARNPHWAQILPYAVHPMGYPCTVIARYLGISAGRVSRAIRRMIEVGLLDPAKRIRARYNPVIAGRQLRLPFCATWGQPVGEN